MRIARFTYSPRAASSAEPLPHNDVHWSQWILFGADIVRRSGQAGCLCSAFANPTTGNGTVRGQGSFCSKLRHACCRPRLAGLVKR